MPLKVNHPSTVVNDTEGGDLTISVVKKGRPAVPCCLLRAVIMVVLQGSPEYLLFRDILNLANYHLRGSGLRDDSSQFFCQRVQAAGDGFLKDSDWMDILGAQNYSSAADKITHLAILIIQGNNY